MAAKEVVLAEKPLISEETDLLEPSLLDQLCCHIGTLASVYHKPPSTFVEAMQPLKKTIAKTTIGYSMVIIIYNADHIYFSDSGVEPNLLNNSSHQSSNTQQQPTVIPSQDSLIADLLSLDLTPQASSNNTQSMMMHQAYQPAPISSGLDELLGLGSDGLVRFSRFILYWCTFFSWAI